MLGALATAFAAILFARALRGRSPDDLAAAVEALPAARLAAAAGFVVAGAVCHNFFDHLALIYAGAPQPWRRAALSSFSATTIGHALSLAGATSSLLRWRMWSGWGVSGEATARALLFCAATVVLGHLALAGFGCLAAPEIAVRATGLSTGGARALGLGCLGVCALYVAAAATIRKRVEVRGASVGLPGAALAVGQIAAGFGCYACVAATLHELIAAVAEVGFAQTSAALSATTAVSAVTRAPSGLGVLETVVPALLPGPDLIGPLLAFRALDLIAPLPFAILGFAVAERLRRGKRAPEA